MQTLFDQISMDIRCREHAELIEFVNRRGLRRSPGFVNLSGPRVAVADVLLRVSTWLAPEEVRRVALEEAVTT